MTATQIARDAYAMIAMSNYRPAAAPKATDSVIARMDEMEVGGRFDVDGDGMRRTRYGMVGDQQAMVQVASMGADTLFLFWNVSGDGHQRRLLVDGLGRTWLDTKRDVTVRQATKYDAVIAMIMAARAN